MILPKIAFSLAAGASAGVVLFGSWIGRPAHKNTALLHPRPNAARPMVAAKALAPVERLEAARRFGDALKDPAAIGPKELAAARALGGEEGVRMIVSLRKNSRR